MAEQSVAKALKSELCECRQDNERLLQSLSDVQKEVLQLRCGPTVLGGDGLGTGMEGWGQG